MSKTKSYYYEPLTKKKNIFEKKLILAPSFRFIGKRKLQIQKNRTVYEENSAKNLKYTF